MGINPYGICAFMFNLLLLIAYFSKRRVQNTENKIYDVMVITSFAGTVVGLLTSYVAGLHDSIYSFLLIIPKLYLLYLVIWGTTFCLYVVFISLDKTKVAKKWTLIRNIIISISCIVGVFVLALPIEYISEGNVTYTSGISVTLVYYLAFLYAIVMFIFIFRNFKNIKNKKYLPVLSFLVLGLVIIFIQFRHPYMLLMTLLVTFNTMLMYFTVENPDVKIIEQMNYLKVKAESEVKAKNEFLKNMSHEMSTPINKAKGVNSFNIEGVKTLKEAKKNALVIDQILDELSEKSKNIINTIKLEGGSLNINIEAYNPSDLFDNIKSLVESTIKVSNKKLVYKEVIKANLPELLMGDKEKLKEVIMQLLNNAIKYTNSGTITLKVDHTVKNNSCDLIIKVKDTGIGIDKEQHKDLFKAFSRIDVENNITINGLGLGLSNSKLIMDSLNGSLELLKSEVGKGSVFVIKLKQDIVT